VLKPGGRGRQTRLGTSTVHRSGIASAIRQAPCALKARHTPAVKPLTSKTGTYGSNGNVNHTTSTDVLPAMLEDTTVPVGNE
jgi:hypothetical protein